MIEDYKEIRLGGYAGAIIAFLITFLTHIAFSLGDYSKNHWMYFSWINLINGPLISALILSLFGFLAGRLAGRSNNPKRAFIWGGIVFFGLILVVLFLPFLIFSLINAHSYDFLASLRRCMVFACLLGFLTAAGSLLCGLSAIVVRDYRQSRKVRLIPQFTLQELLIVVTLSIIVMSFMASFPIVIAWSRQ